MGEYLDRIPQRLHVHIEEITKTSGLPEGDESVELIAQAWLEKKKTFEEKVDAMKMEEIKTLSQDGHSLGRRDDLPALQGQFRHQGVLLPGEIAHFVSHTSLNLGGL